MYPNAQLEDTIGHTFRNLTNINAKLKKKKFYVEHAINPRSILKFYFKNGNFKISPNGSTG